MKTWIEKGNDLLVKLNGFSFRERLIMMTLLLVIIFGLWDYFFFQSLQKQRKTLVEHLNLHYQAIATYRKKTAAHIDQARHDPNAVTKARLIKAEAAHGRVKQAYQNWVIGPLSKDKLGLLLGQLESFGLKFEQLNQKTVPMGPSEKKQFPDALVEHQFQLKFQGSYFQVLSYLRRIEKAPWPLFWDSCHYTVEKYPNAQVVLWFHTLDEGNDKN